MNPEELDALLRQSSSPAAVKPAGGFTAAVVRRLSRRERWQDVCLILGSASVLAFALALAVAARTTQSSAPALRLFQAQPASHPFGTP